MKKGINCWTLPLDMPIDDIFSLAAKTGFDGVELIMGDEGCELAYNSTDDDILRIRDKAEKHGLELPSLAPGLCWKYSLSGDEEMRQKALFYAKRQIEIASLLGCDTILLVPGAVGVSFAPNLGVVPYDIAYERAERSINEIAAFAEEKKVYVGVENVGNKFLLSPLETRTFIDNTKCEYIGAYFDCGNILSTGYPDQWIRILGSRIKKIHVKDMKIGTPGLVDLLTGDVDYHAAMKALSEVGYDGYITAEVEAKPDNEQNLREISAALDKMFSYIA